MIKIGFYLGLIMMLWSCGASPESKECKNGSPIAVFAKIDSFANHRFEVKGQNSSEFALVNCLAMDIELYQSGCQTLEQEYRFILHGTMPQDMPPEVCAMEIANIFYSLSQLDAQLMQFGQWAEAIKIDARNFKYNEFVTLKGSAIKVKILKQHQATKTILTVIFSG